MIKRLKKMTDKEYLIILLETLLGANVEYTEDKDYNQFFAAGRLYMFNDDDELFRIKKAQGKRI